MRLTSFFTALAVLFLSSVSFLERGAFAQDETQSLVQLADRAYSEGDCNAALESYHSIVVDASLDKRFRILGLYRMAYCYYTLEKFTEAEEFFSRYLKIDPNHEEAKLKYLDSQFQQGKYGQVIQGSAGYMPTWTRPDLRLLVGRTFLESRDPDRAIVELNKMNPTDKMISVQRYWIGVAQYQRGDKHQALLEFQDAANDPRAPEWVKSYANDWVRAIQKEFRRFSGSLTFGFFSDGNLNSTSVQPSGTIVGSPSTYDPNSASYVTGYGALADVKLNYALYDAYPYRFAIQTDWSSPFYFSNSSYNNENLGFEIQSVVIESANLRYRMSVRFLDSRYLNLYYQDYLIITPGVVWNKGERWTFSFDIPVTDNLITRHSLIVGPAFGAQYVLKSGLALTGGLSVSKAMGTAATYSGTTWTGGTQFSRYQSYGASLGFNLALPWKFYFSSQVSYYKTQYEDEAIGAGTVKASARSDALMYWSSTLSREIKENLSADLTVNYSSNQSSGFQGIASGTTMTIYSYTKPYALFSSTLRF